MPFRQGRHDLGMVDDESWVDTCHFQKLSNKLQEETTYQILVSYAHIHGRGELKILRTLSRRRAVG